MMLEIKEIKIEEVLDIEIPEFKESFSSQYFKDEYKDSNKLIIVAYYKWEKAWYIVWYDKYSDWSFFCWIAWVNPVFRRKWILKELMSYQFNWVKIKWYDFIRITTRNNRRKNVILSSK